MVIWLTGLSGCGKTTIGRLLYERWKIQAANTVLVDGDDVRRLFELDREDALYTLDARRMVAGRIADLCAWLDDQEINVVCCTISLFADIHERNRQTFTRYFEVYIDTPMEVLRRRDHNGLYTRASRGEALNVIGVDLPFSPPALPDLVIDNSTDCDDLGNIAGEILDKALAA